MSNASSTTALPYGMRLLGWSGVLPFAAFLAIAALDPSRRDISVSMFIGYGAVILSFIGGTRWGNGLAALAHPSRYVESVLPSLMGFAALLLYHTPEPALLVLASGFLIWLVIDHQDRLWSSDYRRMRRGISIVVLLLHAAWLPILW